MLWFLFAIRPTEGTISAFMGAFLEEYLFYFIKDTHVPVFNITK